MNATLIFPLRGSKVLLGMKKRGSGVGWWNGFGGRVEEGETFEGAALRELFEESGLRAHAGDLHEAAQMKFFLPNETQIVHVYFLQQWEGEPLETEEMKPQWFSVDELPYASMWPGDHLWLPELFSGRKIEGELHFGTTTSEVRSVQIKDVNFQRPR